MKYSQLDFRPKSQKPQKRRKKWWGAVFFFLVVLSVLFVLHRRNLLESPEKSKTVVHTTPDSLATKVAKDSLPRIPKIKKPVVEEKPLLNKWSQCPFVWDTDSSGVMVVWRTHKSKPVDLCLEQLQKGLSKPLSILVQKKIPEAYPESYRSISIKLKLNRIEDSLRVELGCIYLHSGTSKKYCPPISPNPIYISSETLVPLEFCMETGECLFLESYASPLIVIDSLPLEKTSVWLIEDPIPQLRMGLMQEFAVGPVKRGKVVKISEAGPFGKSVRLFHGKGLFSVYGNLSEIDGDVTLGKVLELGDTLGRPESDIDSSFFSLWIEKDGIFTRDFQNLLMLDSIINDK